MFLPTLQIPKQTFRGIPSLSQLPQWYGVNVCNVLLPVCIDDLSFLK